MLSKNVITENLCQILIPIVIHTKLLSRKDRYVHSLSEIWKKTREYFLRKINDYNFF